MTGWIVALLLVGTEFTVNSLSYPLVASNFVNKDCQAGILTASISNCSPRFEQLIEKQPVQENKAMVVGDIAPAPYPVINMHVDIPNRDPKEERRLHEERELIRNKIADLSEVEDSNLKSFKQIVTSQSNQMGQLLNLSTTNNNLFQGLLRSYPRGY